MRVATRLTIAALVVLELWLLTGFLPARFWPVKPHDYWQITHPNLEGEFSFLAPYVNGMIGLLAALKQP